ncbi:hypothetical protein [Thiosulfativibrio zosterae]|uniref:Uncharacterized protein n=1 Tax=Thiosulfativibrio zosterae TaxID=2675053 RepID=A0A6F8PP06_9GAMM|nr:hypothetical protein [Thiosulfativibrio zosterae]BBP43849.1 hypothetical protein THMIRHAT_15950 [Thiosulfativibrio zosterae]
MTKHNTSFWIFLVAGVYASATFSDDTAISTQITSGFFISQGQSQTLGSPNSTTYSIPLMISSRSGRFQGALITNYLQVNNDYPTVNLTNQQQGMGDTILSVGYDLLEQPWITLKLKHKFATGDKNKGLSTGKDDTALQLDWLNQFQPNTAGYATLGYKWVGQVNEYAMQNSGYATAGLLQRLTPHNHLGVSLDYTQTSYTELKDALGASLFLSHQLNTSMTLTSLSSYDSTSSSNFGLTITKQF